MRLIDLTHPVLEGMPVYPGTEPPRIVEANSLEEHGFREKKITLYSHTGTHVDAPAHILADGKTLDEFAISSFHGPAVVYTHETDSSTIDIEQLRQLEKDLAGADFLLIATGWDRHWGQGEYFRDFPVLSLEAAKWLERFELKGVGLDAISADPVDSVELAVHFQLLSRDVLLFENLNNLDLIPTRRCTFTGLPLHLEAADGAPIRAFVTVEDE